MIRYLIKNNFKLMLRNTWSIICMIIGPVLVIAVLSSAFSELMKTYEGVDEIKAGYRIEGAMAENENIQQILDVAKEAGISFNKYPEGDVKDIIRNNELAGFVELSLDKYVVYKSEDYEIEGITLEYFMSRSFSEAINSALKVEGQESVMLPTEKLDFMEPISSNDYYGIIYIVYFCCCGIICATGVFSSEKKYGITRRFQVSNISETKNYIGKFIPIVLTISVGMGIGTAISIILFDIHWGSPVISAIIVFMMILASTAFGMMLYGISDNLVITIISLFTVVWIMGFIGGSFETYMFQGLSDSIKQLSPIYHGNRALVELSCMGKSDYVVSSLVYSTVITLVCSMVAIMAGKIRKRGRA